MRGLRKSRYTKRMLWVYPTSLRDFGNVCSYYRYNNYILRSRPHTIATGKVELSKLQNSWWSRSWKRHPWWDLAKWDSAKWDLVKWDSAKWDLSVINAKTFLNFRLTRTSPEVIILNLLCPLREITICQTCLLVGALAFGINALPEKVVNSLSPITFKHSLKKIDLSKFLKVGRTMPYSPASPISSSNVLHVKSLMDYICMFMYL